MHTLVTGGAGFIGSHLVDLLIDDGHDVVVVDNLSHGRPENLAQAQETGKLTFLEADVLEVDFDALVEKHRPEVIFHLAAQIDVRESVADPVHDAETNISPPSGWRTPRAVTGCARRPHLSAAIYGTPEEFPADESVPVDPHFVRGQQVRYEVYLNTFRHLDSTVARPATLSPRQTRTGRPAVAIRPASPGR